MWVGAFLFRLTPLHSQLAVPSRSMLSIIYLIRVRWAVVVLFVFGFVGVS